jgi:hypothetical protein
LHARSRFQITNPRDSRRRVWRVLTSRIAPNPRRTFLSSVNANGRGEDTPPTDCFEAATEIARIEANRCGHWPKTARPRFPRAAGRQARRRTSPKLRLLLSTAASPGPDVAIRTNGLLQSGLDPASETPGANAEVVIARPVKVVLRFSGSRAAAHRTWP